MTCEIARFDRFSTFRMLLVAAACAVVWVASPVAAAQDESGGETGEAGQRDDGDADASNDDTTTDDGATADGGEDDVDRRNPRRIRRERGEHAPPRMVAGGMGIGGEDTLKHYDRLAPLIGEFTIEGRTWRFPDAEPRSFSGEFVNSWALDGWYMQSEITLDFRRNQPYIMLGMTCYDAGDDRYESDFYNSNGDNRTFRWGTFDGEGGDTLTMLSRGREESPDDQPDSKIVWRIVGDDRFTYTGWTYNPDKDEWWKSYELVCTRTAEVESSDKE